jgi:hypothetical protein
MVWVRLEIHMCQRNSERNVKPMGETAISQGRVANKRVLITGAASGIGRATAFLLAREGAWVMATDVDAAGAQATVEGIRRAGGQAIPKQLDVTSESDWQAAIVDIMRAWGGLDVLVATAGISVARPWGQTCGAGHAAGPGRQHHYRWRLCSPDTSRYQRGQARQKNALAPTTAPCWNPRGRRSRRCAF